MGEVSTIVLGLTFGLQRRIMEEYYCSPQIVMDKKRVGFNIKAEEAGRVETRKNGHIYMIYYSPNSHPATSVFS